MPRFSVGYTIESLATSIPHISLFLVVELGGVFACIGFDG